MKLNRGTRVVLAVILCALALTVALWGRSLRVVLTNVAMLVAIGCVIVIAAWAVDARNGHGKNNHAPPAPPTEPDPRHGEAP
jgi:hypothetical protein